MLTFSQRLKTLLMMAVVIAALTVTYAKAYDLPEPGIVAAGTYHTVGLKADGTVVATGGNDDGQCNVSGWTDIVQVAAGNGHTLGLKADGTVVGTGKNLDGRLDVSPWTNIVQVAAGTHHTVGLKMDGTVVAVGYNGYGQCDVSGWTDIVQVAAGAFHSVGLKMDGTVVAAGFDVDTLLNVSAWTSIVQVAASTMHTVGLRADGTVVAVGSDDCGKCNLLDWTNIVEVATGANHIVGLKMDGTVVAVGDNTDGQCNVDAWNLKPNSPPVFQLIGSQQVKEGHLLEFTVLAVDPEGDAITYEAAELPGGAVFDPVSRLFSWQPGFTQAGTYTILFSATDNGTPSMKGELRVTVAVGDVPTRTEQIRALVAMVLGLRLEKDLENSYLANLKKVETFVAANKIIPARNQLSAVIHKAQQDIGQGKIGPAQGQGLMDKVNELIQALTIP